MKRTSLRSLVAALLVGLSLGPAVAQLSAPGSSTAKKTSPGSQVDRADRKFMTEAAQSGLYEVEVSKLAAAKATDPAVKSFATMLVDQHTAANSELAQLAKDKGVELPAVTSHSMRNDIAKLDKLSGAKFDERYAKDVGVKDHQKDIKAFEKGSKNVKDSELKAWIDKTLPTLRQHLSAAEKLPENTKGRS
jgi:putative membrane protein